MQSLTLPQALEAIASAIVDDNLALADQLLWPALDQYPDLAQLWYYAGCLSHKTGKDALAVQCWVKSYELECNPQAWGNIGAGLRQLQRPDLARTILERSLEYRPEDQTALTNLAGCYVNEGNPWPGIGYGERALKLEGPERDNARFNLGLLYLEAGEYGRGFDLYAEGHHRLREKERMYGAEPLLTPSLHRSLTDDPWTPTLIVWAEQGIGDELMFGSILEDVAQDYDIILDCHPRLESLHQNSRWATMLRDQGRPARIFPTRKTDDIGWSEKADAKVAIGNLCRLYRRTPESFRWRGPLYRAPDGEVEQMREQLEGLAGGRKIIGLSMRGGTMSTARTYRQIKLDALRPMLEDDRYLFVCLDYEDMTATAQWMESEYPGRYLWFPSVTWAWDYHHTASLVAATDAVVTVCQSVAHLSAAMGHPTYVLVPAKPAWRYGLKSERWHWYPHDNVRLLRQKGEDWSSALRSLLEALEARSLSVAA